MKLKKLTIENFRGIEHFEHDFTDELGRVRDLTVIVGPNGSGKTAIIDAIWFGLKDILKYDLQRKEFRPEPQFVVRQNQSQARIHYDLMFTQEFVRMINGEWRSQGYPEQQVPSEYLEFPVTWVYPNPEQHEQYTRTPFNRAVFETLSRPHRENNPLRSIGSGVYFFGEERIIKAPPVTQITGSILPSEDNIRLILIDWAVKDRTLRDPSQKSNLYERVQKAFDQICSPRKMGEVYSLDSNGEYFIEFFDEHGIPYTFDGLSSGERSVLNFLVRYHHRHMSHAIVLIDEIETHLHPDWQRRVLRYLRRTGDNNQFIITTHSPAILMSVDADDMILLGYLDQAQQAIPVIEGSSNE